MPNIPLKTIPEPTFLYSYAARWHSKRPRSSPKAFPLVIKSSVLIKSSLHPQNLFATLAALLAMTIWAVREPFPAKGTIIAVATVIDNL
jgi:hypothetical protein